MPSNTDTSKVKKAKFQPTNSTDLFKDKPLPDFIAQHRMFNTPMLVSKIFPAIGLPNFKDKASIEKCLFDFKKEGTYVHNLLRVMVDIVNAAKFTASEHRDKLQFLPSKDSREQNRDKLSKLYQLAQISSELVSCIDPYTNKERLGEIISLAEGKIALRLTKDILDTAGKPIFRKGESLVKALNKLRERGAAIGVDIRALDATNEFKIFCKENIPNKEYNVVFSASGSDGAWDIATMSMRGDWASCQRWEGEYPKCLIGSILSKYTGVMYLTSGVMNSGNEKNGNRANLGTKMMRRCVVRYAIDIDADTDNKACILIDKMYPDLDADILSAFMSSIKSRTKLPVYYSPQLGNKIRHIYIPHEKIREQLSDRELSYQDAPLKSRQDISIFMLNNNKEEVEREIKGFKLNFGLHLARKMEAAYSGMLAASDTFKRSIYNVRSNTQFTPFCDQVVNYMLGAFKAPASTAFTNSSLYYRRYLREILLKRTNILAASNQNLTNFIVQNTSKQVDTVEFINFIVQSLLEFTKLEAKKMVS